MFYARPAWDPFRMAGRPTEAASCSCSRPRVQGDSCGKCGRFTRRTVARTWGAHRSFEPVVVLDDYRTRRLERAA